MPGSPLPAVPFLLIGRSPGQAARSETQWVLLFFLLSPLVILAILALFRRVHPSQGDGREVEGVWDDAPLRRAVRGLLLVHCGALAGLIIGNQNCFQPWAYLSFLVAATLALANAHRAVQLLRILWISIYVYSALCKLDYAFATTLGANLMRGWLDWFHVSFDNWSSGIQMAVVLSLPIVELCVGVGLVWSRTRPVAVRAGCLMHVLLIILLGLSPLNQHPAVGIWNAAFLGQLLLLFAWPTGSDDRAAVADAVPTPAGLSVTNILATALIATATLLPLAEPWGRFDHWPSWGLYAPRNARIIVFVEQGAVARLPSSCKHCLVPAAFTDPEFATPAFRLSINQWSLQALKVPAYPQDRFHVGVALAIAERYELKDGIHLQWQGRSNRFTGARRSQMIDGIEALRDFATERFRFNAIPDKMR